MIDYLRINFNQRYDIDFVLVQLDVCFLIAYMVVYESL